MKLFADIFVKHATHPSWQPLLSKACAKLDPNYLKQLAQDPSWLPGADAIFNAFSLPLANTRYILFGESPYPRKASANGYAFWDARVTDLWSATGLSTQVNRATSLRNFIKMLLVAAGSLQPHDTSQTAIAALDKGELVQSNDELFANLQQQGFLLLNACLALREQNKQRDARYWLPFMQTLLAEIQTLKPEIELILFGAIAKTILDLPASQTFKTLQSEHPYNISFIHNPEILAFFKPLALLNEHCHVCTEY